MSRIKGLVSVLMVLIMVLAAPVSKVLADETESNETWERNMFPKLDRNSEVVFMKKNFFDWFGLKEVPDENVIEEITIRHQVNSHVDYNLYFLQCDFELKTMDEDGNYNTSNCSYTIDFDHFWKAGLIENIYHYLKDNTVVNIFKPGILNFDENDYFVHRFKYKAIVEQAEGFLYKDVTGKGDYTYNTVISQADFYLVKKSTGEKGQVRRFKFTWDSDFWKQLCTKIESCIYVEAYDHESSSNSVESEFGVDEYIPEQKRDEESLFSKLLDYILFVPEVLYVVISGIFKVYTGFIDLLKYVFPFIPGLFFDAFAALIVFSVLVGLWKLVKGE